MNGAVPVFRGDGVRTPNSPIQKTGKGAQDLGILHSFLNGSPSKTRTCDKSVNSRLLYQLSYRGRCAKSIAQAERVKRGAKNFLAQARIGRDLDSLEARLEATGGWNGPWAAVDMNRPRT